MAARAGLWAGLLGMAVLATALVGCGGGGEDRADVKSANTQAEAAKDPAATLNATAVAPTSDAAAAQRRGALIAVKPSSLSSREDALTTAPAPYEGDATAATALPPQTDDAPPAPKGNTAG